MADSHSLKTSILPVSALNTGFFQARPRQSEDQLIDNLDFELDNTKQDAQHLQLAASQLQTGSIPVAFPTETVYGLGADATRSDAVRGIYKAKQRPIDNPLIVHFASLSQLRDLLRGGGGEPPALNSAWDRQLNNSLVITADEEDDPIPSIYHPLIRRFWPGPLTIILQNQEDSRLAPEVTAGLSTFGARIPANLLALMLIQLAGVPIAAPSANASTKPSPTAAEHVAHDLDGRIETIIDGGPCDVGVESTVVDGLCDPPVVLRPGGVSIEQLRSCPGWENVAIGYKNAAEGNVNGTGPRAPGMKYRHYSPKASVVLLEAGTAPPDRKAMAAYLGPMGRVGVIRTRRWGISTASNTQQSSIILRSDLESSAQSPMNTHREGAGFAGLLETLHATPEPRKAITSYRISRPDREFELLDLGLGPDTAGIARGIFGALRELDRRDVDVILVEGIDESEGETAAAVMNRLRKAAEVRVGG